MPTDDQADVIVIGAGIAGLCAAVSAAETLGTMGRVVLVERAPAPVAGGNTRWTSAYFRLDDLYDVGPDFVDDICKFSGGCTSEQYVRRLVELLPETMEWIQDQGVRFRSMPTYFINSSRRRLQPVGGGEEMLTALTRSAGELGVVIAHETTAGSLELDAAGRIAGVQVSDAHGDHVIRAGGVVIAAGGFEGAPEWLAKELGPNGASLRTIAPGGQFNRGEPIAAALAVGAARAGQWDNFHAEPVDPRSSDAEALVMVFPYGIVVNADGHRFTDEGRGTVDETYESLAREVWRQPGGRAYFITDQHYLDVTARDRGVLTSVKPIVADTIDDLAAAIEMNPSALSATVDRFNAATTTGSFDWKQPDGLGTINLQPPKSNWAFPLDRPPFLSYPISCSIVFTFGGLGTDTRARVLREDGSVIDGLFAAGECTGIYFDKYPGGTSVLRGMIFGRVAGREAATLADRAMKG